MSYIEVSYPSDKAGFYALLREQIKLYTDGEDSMTAVLANVSAVIKQAFKYANWVGFYLVSGEELVLGPFQGRPAVTRIGYGRGVCGTAWKLGEAQVVEDVDCFEGHIACDCSTHSEIVIPMRDECGRIWGVLDMDSTETAYFSAGDRDGLSSCMQLIEEKTFKKTVEK